MHYNLRTIPLSVAILLLTVVGYGQHRPVPSAFALVGARIYTAPDAAAIDDGVVGMTLTAAFWNCHVHFIEPKWSGADTMAAKRFNQYRWGTTGAAGGKPPSARNLPG